MTRYLLLAAAVSGFLWVALGAMAGHHVFSDLHASYFEKAQRYQIVHTLAMLIVLLLPIAAGQTLAQSAAVAWLVGMVCFSGGLYAMALTGVQALRFIVPVGGIAFLTGWALLAALVLKIK